MRKNRTKEERFQLNADRLPREKTAESVLIFLVLGIIVLAVHLFTGKWVIVPEITVPGSSQSQNVYVWKTAAPEHQEGLYLYTPAQLAETFPGTLPPEAGKPDDQKPMPMVTAVHYGSAGSRTVSLPPEVANIFFKPIPINRADREILSSLPGIGPVLAERIFQRREEHGPFRSKDELLLVSGIGPKKFARLADHITLN